MNQNDINVLLRKADELRALFVLGQRVIPFLEEIFLFVNEIEPILLEINTSIKENLKKMPKASKQLSKVTEATELATTEILDILDGLGYKNELINSNIKKIREILMTKENKSIDIIKLVIDSIQKGESIQNLEPQLIDFVNVIENNVDPKIDELLKHTEDVNNSIVNDSSSIAMSLQVQDITSQQIAAVNNLLETVQSRLSVIMEKFQESELENLISKEHYDSKAKVAVLHRKIAYDPDAVDSLDITKNRQSNIDSIIEQSKEKGLDEIEKEIKSEINKDDKIVENKKVEIEQEKVSSFETTNDEQDIPIDINQLGDLDDEISQDDIDALFGKI